MWTFFYYYTCRIYFIYEYLFMCARSVSVLIKGTDSYIISVRRMCLGLGMGEPLCGSPSFLSAYPLDGREHAPKHTMLFILIVVTN